MVIFLMVLNRILKNVATEDGNIDERQQSFVYKLGSMFTGDKKGDLLVKMIT
jgi:hypothetical protein